MIKLYNRHTQTRLASAWAAEFIFVSESQIAELAIEAE